MTNDFLRRLHELDATYAGRSVPGGLEDRALARLREAQTRRRARPWTRGTPDAAQMRPAITSADLVSDTIDLAGVTMTARPCAPTREGDVVALPTACHLSGAGVQLSTLGPSRLSGGRPATRPVRYPRGKRVIAVVRRAANPP